VALETGVTLAERGLVEAAAERREHGSDRDAVGGKRERVAARLAARRAHEAGAPEDAHHLGDVRLRDSLRPRQLGDREAPAVTLAPDAQQAAQPVLLLRGELHIIPSWSLAASDIIWRLHGGSKTTCTSASLIPGTVRSLPLMSSRST